MSNPKMQLSVVSPANTYYEGPAGYVQVPTHDGYIGILPRHAPLVSVLGAGRLIFKNDDDETSYVVEGGFLEVLNNRVVVLANSVTAAADIDPEQAGKALEEVLSQKAEGDEAIEARLEKAASARARLKYAQSKQ